MKRIIISFVFLLILNSGCTFIGNFSTYKKMSNDLINRIIREDYKNAYTYFALNKPEVGIPLDTFKKRIVPIRNKIIKNFGTDFDLSVYNISQTTFNTELSGPYPIEVNIQIKNKTKFGQIVILYDDEIKKVIKFSLKDEINPIPTMSLFWLFGLIPLFVLGFNVFTIRRTIKSSIKKKWLKILMIIILNVPAFSYSLVNGFSFGLLNFQILLGFSFGMMGYLGTYWAFGFPIGSLIVNKQISRNNFEEEMNELRGEGTIE